MGREGCKERDVLLKGEGEEQKKRRRRRKEMRESDDEVCFFSKGKSFQSLKR